MYVQNEKYFKTFVIFKNGTKSLNCKSFKKKTNKLKTCQERPHLLSGRFIKVFYKTTTCPRQPLLSGSESGSLIQVWLHIIQIGFWIAKFLSKNYHLKLSICEDSNTFKILHNTHKFLHDMYIFRKKKFCIIQKLKAPEQNHL